MGKRAQSDRRAEKMTATKLAKKAARLNVKLPGGIVITNNEDNLIITEKSAPYYYPLKDWKGVLSKLATIARKKHWAGATTLEELLEAERKVRITVAEWAAAIRDSIEKGNADPS